MTTSETRAPGTGRPWKGAVMAEYSYLDIFATKGIEYMVVLVYFVLFVVFSKAIGAPKKNGINRRERKNNVD